MAKFTELTRPDDFLETDLGVLLRADAKEAVATLAAAGEEGLSVVRYLVESYYDMQKLRMATRNRTDAASASGAPNRLVKWLSERNRSTEAAIHKLLAAYADTDPTGMGVWAQTVVGIGPVIAAGLLAQIDMEKAKNPSDIWRFFGLDPTAIWKKGQKRPWSASAKQLAFKIGDCFMKFHNHDDCFYGKIYERRKAFEIARNDAGLNADACKKTLAERTFKNAETKAYYLAGKFPPGRIELRARRPAVKMFLVHWWAEAWFRRFGTEAPKPYVIEKLGHTSMVDAPRISRVCRETRT